MTHRIRRLRAALCLPWLVMLLAVPAVAEPGAVGDVPAEVRRRLRLHRFYTQHVDVGGLPVIGSKKVSPYALREAAWLIEQMLGDRPDVLARLVRNKVRCSVMAHDEFTTDVPEHSTLEPARFWNKRARGLGATKQIPCVSCAEENLLHFEGDPYSKEIILIHEFAHAVDLLALRDMDRTFERDLQAAYDAAMAAGLWKDLYAAQNKEEYWAIGVQAWFHAGREGGRIHNHVNTRPELRAYDPRLAALIERGFGKNAWIYKRPEQREAAPHLRGFDRAKAPTFQWPPALLEWYRKYEADKQTGIGRIDLPPKTARTAPKTSPTSLHETRILFMNRTSKRLRIQWLDHEGTLKAYGEVPPKQTREQTTLVGHVWVVSDTKGQEVARFVAGAKPGKAIIR